MKLLFALLLLLATLCSSTVSETISDVQDLATSGDIQEVADAITEGERIALIQALSGEDLFPAEVDASEPAPARISSASVATSSSVSADSADTDQISAEQYVKRRRSTASRIAGWALILVIVLPILGCCCLTAGICRLMGVGPFGRKSYGNQMTSGGML